MQFDSFQLTRTVSPGYLHVSTDSDIHDLQSEKAEDADKGMWSTKTRRYQPYRPPVQVTRHQTTNQNSQFRQPSEQAKKSKVFGACKLKDVC